MEQELYDKTTRMIMGCKTREELKTSWNFISLIEKGCPPNPEDIVNKEALDKLRKLWYEKDSEIFS